MGELSRNNDALRLSYCSFILFFFFLFFVFVFLCLCVLCCGKGVEGNDLEVRVIEECICL